MGCTYSVPHYVDSSNNKPRLVFIEPSDTNTNISNNVTLNVNNDKLNNKSKKILKKLYGF